ncbi:MAG: hypothetical protein IPP94_05050 [Ignavibacteria bacterium]|nr:hypothetical protein [Ignavibacteria bacterium]
MPDATDHVFNSSTGRVVVASSETVSSGSMTPSPAKRSHASAVRPSRRGRQRTVTVAFPPGCTTLGVTEAMLNWSASKPSSDGRGAAIGDGDCDTSVIARSDGMPMFVSPNCRRVAFAVHRGCTDTALNGMTVTDGTAFGAMMRSTASFWPSDPAFHTMSIACFAASARSGVAGCRSTENSGASGPIMDIVGVSIVRAPIFAIHSLRVSTVPRVARPKPADAPLTDSFGDGAGARTQRKRFVTSMPQ